MKNEVKMNKNSIITMIVAVIAIAIGFFGGMKYQQSQTRTTFGFQSGNGRGPGANGAFLQGRGASGANRPVSGTILSSDDTSITVKTEDGGSKIVVITGSTSINKAAEATKEDLTTGTRVAAFGTTNADGSVTAVNVQLNPQMRLFGGQGGQGTPAALPNQPSNE